MAMLAAEGKGANDMRTSTRLGLLMTVPVLALAACGGTTIVPAS